MQLSDITEYYSNDNNHFSEDQYKRKRNKIEEVIGVCEFELCGLPIIGGSEVYLDNKKIFCSSWHMNEQRLLEEENL